MAKNMVLLNYSKNEYRIRHKNMLGVGMSYTDVLKDRLRIAFGNDTQEEVAEKIGFAQSTISKIMNGKQDPTVETLYLISQKYHVSIDWLLGLSEEREPSPRKGSAEKSEEITYSYATRAIFQLYRHNVAEFSTAKGSNISITLNDPLLSFLTSRCKAVFDADHDMLQDWFEKKLSLFDSKPLFYYCPWNKEQVFYSTIDAQTESDWLDSYEIAQQIEDEYSKLVDGPDASINNEPEISSWCSGD